MRTNLPVSNNEAVLRDDAMIVSKTDLKGRITYINRDFLEISGFSESELIGAPHNLVRHPDMPPEAFEDLWATLQAGRPWTGLVKNRCKNGDFYWVLANATPLFENGQIMGYLSVRRKAPRDKIEEAERIYRLFREKKQGKLRIRHGQVVSGRGSVFRNLRLSARLGLAVGILLVVMAGVMAGIGLYGTGNILDKAEIKDLANQFEGVQARIHSEARLAESLAALSANLAPVQEALEARDREKLAALFGPGFKALKDKYGVEQLQFHTPPAISFLRLHKPEKFGDDLSSFRHTVVKANQGKVTVSGLENGVGGLGVRGVVPVARDGKHLGTLEFGLSFGKAFLDKFKQDYGVDLSFATREGDGFKHMAGTTADTFMPPAADLESAFAKGPVFYRTELAGKSVAVYIAAVKDYSGQPLGVMALMADRSQYAEALNSTRFMMFGATLALLLLGGLVVAWLARSLSRPLDEVESTLSNVSQGIYSNHIDISRDDELGVVMQELQTLQTRFGFELAESKRVAEENLRIRFGLESVTVPVTLSDDSNRLIFMNQAATDLWQGMAGEIGKRVPGFSAQGMLGNRVGDYLEDEAVIAAYRSPMKETRVFDMGLAGRRLRVTASPVHDHSGAYRGRLSQWVDRTAEVAVESEVSTLVEAAAHGDFSRRLGLEGKSGFYLRVSGGLNKLMEEVSRGLEDVGRVLNAIARGALTERVGSEYEGTFGRLADDTNTTVSRLQEVVGRIKDATEAINLAAREIAQGNSDLSSRTEEQASSLEETASSMEEINATVKQNAENARQAKNLAAGSHEVVQRSGQMVGQVVDTMAGIADSSRKMSDIIGVIDSIAFQTNILALNAAVEAARAGEQGRGFAVVASEVRALAQRSATAAKEIKVLIAASVDKVEGGVQLVQEAGRTMGEVVASFQKVAALVTEIASASVEQSSGVEQVTLAVGQMDEVTQQNAALVEQAAAAAESLEDQARSLSRTVSVFRLSDSDQPVRSEEPVRSAPKALAAKSSAAAPRRAAPAARLASPAHSTSPAHPAPPPGGEDEWEEF